MYQGSFSISMDAKGRLAIPAKVREALQSDCSGNIVVTANPDDKCLVAYPRPRWLEKLPDIKRLPNSNKKAAKMKRALIGYATELEVAESNGRVLIPPTLREFAKLEKKVVLVGQDDYLEIWDEQRWQAYLDDEDEGEMPDFSF